MSRAAVAVVEGLRDAGFDAYLVGGCVRDLLLGQSPKDFDVASDATPEQVRDVFAPLRSARVRIVGRRFRIAHVRLKREVTEVSTYRRAHDSTHGDDAAHPPALGGPVVSSQGVILRDNAYGAIHEDAFRRDFTINALYYDPVDHVLLDYCDGIDDVERRVLRIIGDPEQRFREDPVRILRALRFAAKLGLSLHPDTERAIAPAADMLREVPPARLFDEFGKLFLGGYAAATFDLLRQHGLATRLLPLGDDDGALARLALANTDQRLRQDKPVTPGFLLAAFLWHGFVHRTAPRRMATASDEELDAAGAAVIGELQSTLAIPRRHGYFVREVWRLQPRLMRRTRQSVPPMLAHRRFRAAYDFLLLRAETDGDLKELADWWTEAQTLDAGELTERLPDERSSGERPARRRRRRRYGRGRRASNGAATVNGAAASP